MLTLFAVPKPFRDHIGVIQRNAIQSWIRLDPAAHIILFGDEEGVADVASEFALTHVPHVARNQFGTPLLNATFDAAQRLARRECLCYVNADIILMSDFVTAVRKMPSIPFLMVGHRWNLNLPEPLEFSARDWEARLRERAERNAVCAGHWHIDYFVFRRGAWQEIPAFAVGRPCWDNWMIWRARTLGYLVVDATDMVMAIHQTHDYGHVPQAVDGTWNGPEGEANLALAGGIAHLFNLRDANRVLTNRGLRRPGWTIDRLHRYLDTVPVLYPSYAGAARVARRVAGPRGLTREFVRSVKTALNRRRPRHDKSG